MRVFFGIIVVMFVLASTAAGDVEVWRTCFNGATTRVATLPAGLSQIIEINPSLFTPTCGGDGRATFRISTTSPSDDIGLVRFVGPGGSLVNDVLVTNSNVTQVLSTSNYLPTGQDWAGLDPGPYSMQVQANIGRDLVGPVSADNVVRLVVGGMIGASADVQQTDPTNPLHAVIAVGDIAGDVVAGSTTSPANNIVLVESTSGNISGAVSAWLGDVQTVRADSGTISGSITSGVGVVSLIKARNFTGSVTATGFSTATAQNWAILTIETTEDIGTPTSPATITTFAGPGVTSGTYPSNYENGGIQRIQARNIYANVTTPRPPNPRPYTATNSRGDIRQIITTGLSPTHGKLVGTIQTFSLGDLRLSPGSRAMDLSGNLEGSVLLGGTIKNPVFVQGSIPAGGMLTLTDKDLAAVGDVTVSGQLAGRIEVEGDAFGDLRINPGSTTGVIKVMGDVGNTSHVLLGGPMAGTVEVGMHLFGRLTLSGPVTGTVRIGGDVRSQSICNSDPNRCARINIVESFASSARLEVGGSVYSYASDPGDDAGADMIVFSQTTPLAGTVKIGDSLFGRIITAPPTPQAGGLSGQVIINANDNGGIFDWGESGSTMQGRVRIGSLVQPVRSGIPGANYASPLSGEIGGGAVGVAPFELHEEDCVPTHLNNAMARSRPALLTSSFLDPRPASAPEGRIRIRSYGPLRVVSTPAVRIEVQDPDENHPCAWHAADAFFTVTLFPGGNKRLIELTRVSTGVPYAGVYRVVPQGLVCDEVEGDPAPAWPTEYLGSDGDPAYTFWVGADCGGPVETDGPNGRWDKLDIMGDATVTPPVPACGNCDVAPVNGVLDWCQIDPGDTCQCDWNGTGVVSVQDLFDFLQCFFAGDADFNASGATTVQDIFDFLNCFFTTPHPCVRL